MAFVSEIKYMKCLFQAETETHHTHEQHKTNPATQTTHQLIKMQRLHYHNLRPTPDESNQHYLWKTIYHSVGPGPETGFPRACQICMNSINPQDHVLRHKPCNTLFHRRCLHRWFKELQDAERRPTCPHCRGEMHMTDDAQLKRKRLLLAFANEELPQAEETAHDLLEQYWSQVGQHINRVLFRLNSNNDPINMDIGRIARPITTATNIMVGSINQALYGYQLSVGLIRPPPPPPNPFDQPNPFDRPDDDDDDDDDDNHLWGIAALFDS